LLQADSPSTMDVVFADAAGTFDLARDGIGRAFNAYKIGTAAVSMTKTARVISDPVNLLVNPRAIPGAVMEYCLTVSNAARHRQRGDHHRPGAGRHDLRRQFAFRGRRWLGRTVRAERNHRG